MIVNGWKIFPHPIFRRQYFKLADAVRKAREADPNNFHLKRAAKLLKATRKMAFEDIPSNPADEKFRQGMTLGGDYRHWRRGKYLQQYRLFFRFNAAERTIILAWVNDEETKRAYNSRNDAYLVFGNMLKRGRPPDDWKALLAEAQSASGATDDDLFLL